MFEKIKSLLPPSVPVHDKRELEQLSRKIASRVSSGNVSLQFGNFLTEADMRKLREEVLDSSQSEWTR